MELEALNTLANSFNQCQSGAANPIRHLPSLWWPELRPNYIKDGEYKHTQLGTWLESLNAWFDKTPPGNYRYYPDPKG